MKVIFLFFLFILCSCSQPVMYLTFEVPQYNLVTDINITGNTVNEKMQSIETWIYSNIIMKEDEEIHRKPYWQTPEETVELKTGDCEDLCILFLWMCYQYLEVKPNMVVLHRWEEDHAISIYGDFIFADYFGWYESKDYIYLEHYSWESALINAEYLK